jgi:hypothetical protein
VFKTGEPLLVHVAVIVRLESPNIEVSSFLSVVRVICKFGVAETVPSTGSSRVGVVSPETNMRGLALVTVF